MGYHEGERAVQRRAGWTREDWGSAGVGATIPAVASRFLRQQRVIFIGAADTHAAVWATVVTGPAGFAHTVGDRIVIVNSLPARQDPLSVPLEADLDVGMLAIEPQTRRRLRINGRSQRQGDRLAVRAEQVYSNCPKSPPTPLGTAPTSPIAAAAPDSSVCWAPGGCCGLTTSVTRCT